MISDFINLESNNLISQKLQPWHKKKMLCKRQVDRLASVVNHVITPYFYASIMHRSQTVYYMYPQSTYCVCLQS